MDFELPVGYPMTEDAPISNWCIFSHIRDYDIEMQMDTDALTLPVIDLFEEGIFTGAIKKADNSDFNGAPLIFGIAPLTTAEYAVTPQPNDHKLVDNDAGAGAGGFDGENVSSPYNNNNNVANNHNKNNNDKKKSIKRKLNCVDEHTDDGLKLHVPSPKRVSPFLNTRKQRKAERKRVHRLTVCKLQKIEDTASLLRKYLLISNILLRLYKIEP